MNRKKLNCFFNSDEIKMIMLLAAVCLVMCVSLYYSQKHEPDNISEAVRAAEFRVRVEQLEKRVEFMERMIESMKRKTIEVMVMPPHYIDDMGGI